MAENKKREDKTNKTTLAQEKEREKAVDDLVQAAVSTNLSTEEIFEAVMLGASKVGFTLAARIFLHKECFKYIPTLAQTGKLSYTVFEALAMYIYDKKLFGRTDVVEYLFKPEIVREKIRKVYEDRLLICSLKEIVSFRSKPGFYDGELHNLIIKACNEGNIIVAKELAEWADQSLTTRQIQMLEKTVREKDETSLQRFLKFLG